MWLKCSFCNLFISGIPPHPFSTLDSFNHIWVVQQIHQVMQKCWEEMSDQLYVYINVCVCPFWPCWQPLCWMAALWRGQNLSGSIARELHTETLRCFTVISQPSALVAVWGQRVQDGGSRRAKKWAQTQDASLPIQFFPISYSLLSFPAYSVFLRL